MRLYFEIQTEHIGREFLEAFGKLWRTTDWIGRILPGDVGKRVYLVDGILQVENDEQRLQRERPSELLKLAEQIIADDLEEDPDRVFDATPGYQLAVLVVGEERERELRLAHQQELQKKG